MIGYFDIYHLYLSQCAEKMQLERITYWAIKKIKGAHSAQKQQPWQLCLAQGPLSMINRVLSLYERMVLLK